jgi:hypothetical protein
LWLAILPQFSPHGRGVMRGATVGNGVAVGEGVADAPGLGVATCACAPAKKATKPTRTHTQTKRSPTVFACSRLDVGVEWLSFSSLKSRLNNSFKASVSVPSAQRAHAA